jgi:hypothetical protein
LADARDTLKSVEVFVKSRERINRPTGEEWFDARLATLERVLAASPLLPSPQPEREAG